MLLIVGTQYLYLGVLRVGTGEVWGKHTRHENMHEFLAEVWQRTWFFRSIVPSSTGKGKNHDVISDWVQTCDLWISHPLDQNPEFGPVTQRRNQSSLCSHQWGLNWPPSPHFHCERKGSPPRPWPHPFSLSPIHTCVDFSRGEKFKTSWNSTFSAARSHTENK